MTSDSSSADRPRSASAEPIAAQPLVCVSIVHWNGGQSTLDCLESVHRQDRRAFKVLLVDNGSTDDVVPIVRGRWPDTVVLVNEANRGFTGGHNQGIAAALALGADYVLLLNQDATLQPGCIDRMVELFESDAQIGLVSPVIYYADDPARVQFCGGWIDWTDVKTGGSRRPEVMREHERAGQLDLSLWGTAIMMRRALIEDIGVLDDRLFAYFEDTDYSVRSLRAGWKNRVCFDAGALHDGHATRYTRGPHVFYLSSRNSLLFWKKAFRHRRGGAIRWRRKAVASILHEAGTLKDVAMLEQATACVDGLWAGWMGRYGPYDERRPAPRWFRRLALGHPYLWWQVLEGNFGGLLRRLKAGASG